MASSSKDRIAARLWAEGDIVEAQRLYNCGNPLRLVCRACHAIHTARLQCNRRWCPECAQIRASTLVDRYGRIVELLPSCLFWTTTIHHEARDSAAESFARVRPAIKKIRRQKWFREKVRGGIWAIEVSSGDNGWHIHVHWLLDCDWLSVTTPAPSRLNSKTVNNRLRRASQRETGEQWALVVGQESAITWIRRAAPGTTREVLKYSVKPEKLESAKGSLSELFKAMKSVRMAAPWGSIRKAARVVSAEEKADRHGLECDCGECDWALGPSESEDSRAWLDHRKTSGRPINPSRKKS